MSKLRSAGCLLAAIAALSFGQGAAAASKNLLKNGSFEKPSLTADPPPHFGKKAILDLPYYVRPFGKSASWLYPTGAGILNTTATPNPWGDPLPSGYSGLQFAFLQGLENISQSFTVETPGVYQVAWFDAGRPDGGAWDGNQTYEVLLNGAVAGTFNTTSGQNFTPESVQVTLPAGTNVIEFLGASTVSGDHTAFLDVVSVTLVP
jgi:hypothetical protein